jgi:hypothetical protein
MKPEKAKGEEEDDELVACSCPEVQQHIGSDRALNPLVLAKRAGGGAPTLFPLPVTGPETNPVARFADHLFVESRHLGAVLSRVIPYYDPSNLSRHAQGCCAHAPFGWGYAHAGYFVVPTLVFQDDPAEPSNAR